MAIVVFSNLKEHLHEEDPYYSTPVNYHWTEDQERVIEQGIRSGT